MTTHESIDRKESMELGSDRSFGLIIGAILSAIGAYQFAVSESSLFFVFAVPGAFLIGLGLVAPRLLHPLNVLWAKFGILLGRIVTPIVMFLVYVITIVPIGIILKIVGKDLLSLEKDESISSYWIDREPQSPSPESLKDQF